MKLSGFFKSGWRTGIALLAAFSMILSGCGNDSAPAASSTISGTVATGAPMAGFVYVTDKNGVAVNTAIGADGGYSISVSGMTAPFMVKAVPSSGDTLYSYAADANIIANVTPLTTLALFQGHSQGDLEALYNSWASSYSALTTASIQAAQATINANFATQMQAAGLDPNTYDFFKTAFTANSSGFDAVLDGLNVTINFGAGTFAITDGADAPISFNLNIDTSGINIGDGSGSGSGSSSGGTLPAGVAGQVVTMEYCCAASGSPYSNGDQVLFTFSSSGALMLTEQYTVVAETFTVDSYGQYIWTATDGAQYQLSLTNGAIHEVNVMSAAATFLGQFTPVSGSSGGSTAASYKMILSGTYMDTSNGVSINVGPMTLSGPFPAPTISSVETSFTTTSYGATGTVTVTTLIDTEAEKKFRVQFSGTGSASAPAGTPVSEFDLIYDYIKI
jgi:hypothetical protein